MNQAALEMLEFLREHIRTISSLEQAAAGDDYFGLEVLLSDRKNVSADELRCALHLAATAGACDGAHLLLERGADPDRQDDQGKSALRIAKAHGHGEMVRLLRVSKSRAWGWWYMLTDRTRTFLGMFGLFLHRAE